LYVTGRDFNRAISDEKFHLFRCDQCGLMFINNPPADLGRYYPSDYHSMPASADGLDPYLPGQRFKIDLLKRFVAGGTLLEIGPSNGIFCRLAQKAGFDVSAIEMDENCVRFLQDKLGVRTIASPDPADVLNTENLTYDAICLWHTIEHLQRPWDVLAQAARRLKPGGVLLVAAPNPDAWQARLLGVRWPHHDMPRHLFALPIPWLRELGRRLGLTTEMVTTRDEGSLFWNRFTWAMLLRSIFRNRLLRGLSWRAGMFFGHLLEPWEGHEGRGACYTAVLRGPE
jgi:SAM-dependent methyltransferase